MARKTAEGDEGEKSRGRHEGTRRARGDLRTFRTDGGEMVCSAPRGRFHQSEFKLKTSKYT